MNPIIGITSQPNAVANASGQLDSHVIGHTYTDSVLRSGGLPVSLVPVPHKEIPLLLDRIDGLVLSGGGDVEPHRYGQDRHAKTRRTNVDRDEFELALARAAYERRMPLLAICRGIQVVNVAFGGTLIQDIPSAIGSKDHTVIGHAVYDGHQPVTIAADSKIAKATGKTEMLVNSIHHQAIDHLAEGFRAVAWADDGIIEGIEHEDEDWQLLGVQWHPEFLGENFDEPSHRLFDAIVQQAAEYRDDLGAER
ncbi:MAG: gamma-glutamyl-gamma-aminobutyrate hydrolase family protein [Acidimicrobiia bacterium]|nr:MAG: gamma-glutamyl-gamma-aminobutyrate hydrolase family protein [Acidimicrobiia bacterium]